MRLGLAFKGNSGPQILKCIHVNLNQNILKSILGKLCYSVADPSISRCEKYEFQNQRCKQKVIRPGKFLPSFDNNSSASDCL